MARVLAGKVAPQTRMVRQGLFESNNVCLGLSKWGLIIFNMVFWLMGVVSLGIGLWLYTTFNEFAAFSDGGRLLGSVFLVATGFGVIIVGFLGIVAALWESRIIATVFCVLIVLALGMYVCSGAWSLREKSRLPSQFRGQLQRTLQEYDHVEVYVQVWDIVHRRYNCCGVNGSNDWAVFREVIPRPPPSCCVSTECPAFHAEGCIQELQRYETRQLDIIGPIGLAFGAFQVVGVVMSVLFCHSLHNTKGSYYT